MWYKARLSSQCQHLSPLHSSHWARRKHLQLPPPPPYATRGCHTSPGGSGAVMGVEYPQVPPGCFLMGDQETCFSSGWGTRSCLHYTACLWSCLQHGLWSCATGGFSPAWTPCSYVVTCLHTCLLLLLAGFSGGTLDLAHHPGGCQCSPCPTLLHQIPITGWVVFTQFPKTPEKKSTSLFDSRQLRVWFSTQGKRCFPWLYQGKKERRSGITSHWAMGTGDAPSQGRVRRAKQRAVVWGYPLWHEIAPLGFNIKIAGHIFSMHIGTC